MFGRDYTGAASRKHISTLVIEMLSTPYLPFERPNWNATRSSLPSSAPNWNAASPSLSTWKRLSLRCRREPIFRHQPNRDGPAVRWRAAGHTTAYLHGLAGVAGGDQHRAAR